MHWRSKHVVGRAAVFAAVSLIGAGIFTAPRTAFGTTFEIERVDGDSTSLSGYVGLAVDGAGGPHLIYGYDSDSARYARKTGGAWTYDRLDFAFLAEGGFPSIECDVAGNPRIIYQMNNVEAPMYLRKAGGSWSVENPQGFSQSGMFNSLELDAQSFPHFTDLVGGLSYMIRYHRRVAAGWITETVEFVNEIGVSGSCLALDANDQPHVTYTGPQSAFRYARRTGGTWTIEAIDPAGAGIWSPIAIDGSGNPCVAYSNVNGIRFAKRAGGTWTFETVTTGVPFGFSTLSMALDSQNEPHLIYTVGFTGGDLYYARRAGGVWTEEIIVDTDNNVGFSNALIFDTNGDPHIVFSDGTEGDIYYGRVPSRTSVTGWGGVARDRRRIQISPNPSFDGNVAIRVFASAETGVDRALAAGAPTHSAEARIFDASGRLVKQLGAIDLSTADPRITWNGYADDGGSAAPGVYWIRLVDDHAAVATQRFVIVR